MVEFDLVGVGLGPANLALAVALTEAGYTRRHAAAFLEANPHFVWHDGMLLHDAKMQISFLKDLISTHDPTSTFSFLAYLQAKGRLRAFINQKDFFPSRREFHDYLSWAAGRLPAMVRYGRRVTAVEPMTGGGIVKRLRLQTEDEAGRIQTFVARAVVVAAGGMPHIPPVFLPASDLPTVFHTARYLPTVSALSSAPERIAVIGAGQSAAEVFLDLHARFPNARLDLLLRGFALHVADASPFVNEIFEPSLIDLFHQQPKAARDRFLAEFRHTNYAAVDEALLQRMSDLLYQQRIGNGGEAIRIRSRQRIVDVKPEGRTCAITVYDKWTRKIERSAYDLVVLATGYEREGWRRLLAPLETLAPGLVIDQGYRLAASPKLLAPVFVQGGLERTHGVGETLLSHLPERAQVILHGLMGPDRDVGGLSVS